MRYFRSGNRVVRVDTNADLGPEFLKAVSELYSMRRDGWVKRPELTADIVYTGDWDPCSEREALDAIEQRQKRQFAQYA